MGEKGCFFANCAPKFGLHELTGYELYQPFASVGTRRDFPSVNTLVHCGGPLFFITSESIGESVSGAHDLVIGIRTRLQVNVDISDKLTVYLLRDDIVKTFPIHWTGTVECTRGASLGDGEERAYEGKLAVTDRGFPPI